MTFWTADVAGVGNEAPRRLSEWVERTRGEFGRQLARIAGKFPLMREEHHEDQKHVTLFIHGYNNSAKDALKRYSQIC